MKLLTFFKKIGWSLFSMLLYFPFALADSQSGPIPLSQAIINEATNDGVDGTWMYIMQSVALPILEIISSSLILYAAISSILSGVADAKAERCWAPLKLKITVAVLVILFGGVCVFLMDKLRTYTFSN